MKTLIAIPHMDTVPFSFMMSLMRLMSVGETQIADRGSSLVYDARNRLAGQAVSQGYDRMLFLDSDMVFRPDLLVKLSQDLDEGREYVCGLFFSRKPAFEPVIYKTLEYKCEGIKPEMKLEKHLDYPQNEVFQIAGSGFGAVLMTTDLINKVGDKFGYPFSPVMGLGEDLSFCWRVQQLGIPMYCDSRVKVGHAGILTVSEETYLSNRGN